MRLVVFVILALGLHAHDAKGKSHAPASSKALKNPLTAAKADTGKEKYVEACAGCHGENGKGVTQIKPAPADLTAHHMHSLKDGEIYWVITNGIGKTMPGFKAQLSDTERWQIVLYVRQLSH